MGFSLLLLLRHAIQLLGQFAGQPRLGWRNHAGLQSSGVASLHASAGRGRPNGFHELHHAHNHLHDHLLRPWLWAIPKRGTSLAICRCVSDMDFSTGCLADLAAAFLVWSAGMAVALPDISAMGTVPANPG